MIQEEKSISNIAYAVLSQLHKLFIQMNLAEICSIVCYLSNIISCHFYQVAFARAAIAASLCVQTLINIVHF